MTHDDDDDAIAPRARELFEAASSEVDPVTAGRLRLARRAALAGSARPVRGGVLLLAGAGAGALAVAMAAWLAWPRVQSPVPAPIVVGPAPPAVEVPREPGEPPDVGADPAIAAPNTDAIAIEPTGDEEDWVALEDEDAELYAWLADAPVAPDAGDAL